MLPDRVSNQGPLTYESGALSIAARLPRGKRRVLATTTLTVLCGWSWSLLLTYRI